MVVQKIYGVVELIQYSILEIPFNNRLSRAHTHINALFFQMHVLLKRRAIASYLLYRILELYVRIVYVRLKNALRSILFMKHTCAMISSIICHTFITHVIIMFEMENSMYEKDFIILE